MNFCLLLTFLSIIDQIQSIFHVILPLYFTALHINYCHLASHTLFFHSHSNLVCRSHCNDRACALLAQIAHVPLQLLSVLVELVYMPYPWSFLQYCYWEQLSYYSNCSMSLLLKGSHMSNFAVCISILTKKFWMFFLKTRSRHWYSLPSISNFPYGSMVR